LLSSLYKRLQSGRDMSGNFHPVTHVLFDMDGLILDTEPLYTSATEAVARNHGAPIQTMSWDLKVKQMGLPSQELATLLVQEMQLPITAEQFTLETRQIQETTFPACQLLPGAERLVRHLASSGVGIAVATSSPDKTFRMKTSNHRALFNLFHHVVCGTSDPEVVHGKPAPDIFQVCSSRFPPTSSPFSPASCLVFEDSPAGVRAGLAAGMQVVMVPDARMFDTPQHIPQPGPSIVLKSLEMFRPEMFGLPPFPGE